MLGGSCLILCHHLSGREGASLLPLVCNMCSICRSLSTSFTRWLGYIMFFFFCFFFFVFLFCFLGRGGGGVVGEGEENAHVFFNVKSPDSR